MITSVFGALRVTLNLNDSNQLTIIFSMRNCSLTGMTMLKVWVEMLRDSKTMRKMCQLFLICNE
ncbi:hypothetical protein BBM62_19205 [Vibrio parahaemolyticus]|nr:hypothetical protein ACS89_10075 [Vibrio parahaemolyticus]KOE18925.1 hypothetical protein ACS90_12520 [Vibrio parahaemolyticus]KOF24993.1 hypothetical protein ACX16_01085 [Vibrio parahaemolyticus]OEA42139.1 hypothetical protein BBM62_19205 [Vibrio parahaemolyticus]OQU03668.1 hypothetical protein EN00_010935 [Vibrio parahaemolyticus]